MDNKKILKALLWRSLAFYLVGFSTLCNAQKSIGTVKGFYMDYVVNQNNDTIYGAIVTEGVWTYIRYMNPDYNGQNDMFIKEKCKGIKSYRKNGFVTANKNTNQDGIYNASPVADTLTATQKDYIVFTNGDTIYGDVRQPYVGSKYLKKPDGTKIKFDKKNVKAYADGQFVFELWEKSKLNFTDNKESYLLLLYKGKNITLYGDRDGKYPAFYIYKEGVLHQLKLDDHWWDKLKPLIKDSQPTVNLFTSGFLIYDNMYLAVRYYSEHHSI